MNAYCSGTTAGGWANVKTSKGSGWISEYYLAKAAPKPMVVAPAPKPEIVNFNSPRWTTAESQTPFGSR